MRNIVQLCLAANNILLRRKWNYAFLLLAIAPFSSPEPLGLICNQPVTKKRRALGTRFIEKTNLVTEW